mgnify:CR=1 FL=1
MKLSEHQIQNLIKQYLESQGWFVLRLNSGAVLTKRGQVVRLCPAGTPDLFCLKKGKCVFIEVKTAKNKVTLLQDHMLKIIEEHGAQTIIAYSLEDVIGSLE